MATQQTLRETIESISNLPTLPSVVERITRLLEDPQTSAEEIGRAITVDQSLASKVLKLVNSAFYGFPGKISTITHAIVILGFSTVKNVVLTASIFDAFKKRGQGNDLFDMEQFWRHSVGCGAAAQSLAKQIGFQEKEACFIAGLIHDVGKIILHQYMPEEFNKVVEKCHADETLFLDAEHALFDIAHDEIGSILVEKWKLPQSLFNPVRYHHLPSPSHNHYMITAAVHAADILVRAMDIGNGGDDKIPVMNDRVWKDLGLENANLSMLLDSIEDETEKATVFLQMT